MPINARFDRGDRLRLENLLEQLDENVADLDQAGAWQATSDILGEEFEELFQKEGGISGAPRWSRLSPQTVEQRQRRNFTPIRIGWASGRMAQSLIEPTRPGAVEIRRRMEFVRGTAVSNEGTSYPAIFAKGRGGQPARPIVGRLFGAGNTRTVNRITEAIAEKVFGDVDR